MTAVATALPHPRERVAPPPLERWAHGGLLAVLLAAPLPLAGAPAAVRGWLWLAAGGAAALVLWCHRRRHGGLPRLPGGWPCLGFAALALAQLLPLPWWHADAAHAVLGDGLPRGGTLVPVRTATRLLELLALWATAQAMACVGDRGERARPALGALVLLAALLCGHGALVQAGALPTLDDGQVRDVLVATFGNRNHLGNLLAMALLAGAGLFAARRQRGAAAGAQAALAVALLAAAGGLLATHSRGALLGLGAGAVAFAALAAPTARQARLWLGGGAVAATTALVWLLPGGLLARFAAVGSELQSAGTRPDIWRGAVQLWQLFPWLGTGLGTFGDLSPATQSAAVPGRVENAHCEPLELLVETGALGLGLAVAAALAFAAPLLRRCRATGDRQAALLAAGCLAALAASAVQALAEFQLQIPANALWFAALAGVAAGLLRPRREPLAAGRRAGAALAVAGLAALGGGWRALAHDRADGLAAIAAARTQLARDPAAAAAAAAAALDRNPCSPRAHRLRGEALLAVDPPAARAAFAASLQWTNPAERPQHQLDLALVCLAAGAPALAAGWLFDALPRLPDDRLLAACERLYAAAPAAELLLPLVPPAPARVRAALAEALLRQGDFAGRERVLAAQRGAAAPALLTLADGVLLTSATAAVTPSGSGRDVRVTCAFARPAGAGAPELVLRGEGPGAAFYRSFAATGERFDYTAHLDATFPPGDYTLALDFRRGAPFFPFASFALAAAPLDLADGATAAASQLYWSTAEPGRRQRPRDGVPLRAGDRLWREVRLPPDAAELVVQTAQPTRLAARLDDDDLAPARPDAAAVLRFRLPARPGGVLSLAACGDDAPPVRQLFVTRRTGR